MIIGTFAISMQTPMGVEKGVLTLQQNGEKLNGTLKSLGVNNLVSGFITADNQFELKGIIRKMFVRIPFTAHGKVNGNTLTATAETKHGTFSINGIRS